VAHAARETENAKNELRGPLSVRKEKNLSPPKQGWKIRVQAHGNGGPFLFYFLVQFWVQRLLFFSSYSFAFLAMCFFGAFSAIPYSVFIVRVLFSSPV